MSMSSPSNTETVKSVLFQLHSLGRFILKARYILQAELAPTGTSTNLKQRSQSTWVCCGQAAMHKYSVPS
jgi:hypothetical protein